ncbi:MAG: radical SAM protein [Methanotrichaceae archaeon]|nr:radical SAM protein [Methanotrichaceae archaeon]
MGWQTDEVGSFFNYLPRGCRICQKGASLVLFVTGLCDRACFYCPLSEERSGKDVVFADERPVQSLEDIIEEAHLIGAEGTGITGGEPLLRLDRVLEFISGIKREFGAEHHIHLYTGTLPSFAVLQRLKEAGLDEIRFHPPESMWSSPEELRRSLREAQSLGLEAGVEIPAIAPAPEIVKAVKEAGAFLNLNQLEFSDSNAEALRSRGFTAPELGCGVQASEEIVRLHFRDEGLKVHYCPSVFKDAVQLRERLRRRAERVARPFDRPTEDGTIVYGIISGDQAKALRVLQELGVPEDMYAQNQDGIEIAAIILEDISADLKDIGLDIHLIERYPLVGGMVVERIPL